MADEKKQENMENNPENPDNNEVKLKIHRPVPWKGLRPGWDPIVGLETIKNTMTELISDIFCQPGGVPMDIPWQPEIDMYSDNGDLHIDISLPGCTRENIQIHATSDLLIIRGDCFRSLDIKDDQYFVRERKEGKFSRSIPLPFIVIPEKIKANYKNGLLRVIIPVKSEEKPGRKIEIE